MKVQTRVRVGALLAFLATLARDPAACAKTFPYHSLLIR